MRIFVEGRVVNLAVDLALKIGHFFRAFIDEQDDEHDLRMIKPDRLRDFFQQNGLADPRRGHDETPLAFAQGREKIDRTRADRFVFGVLEDDPACRIKRRQVIERDRLLPFFYRPALRSRSPVEHERFLALARQP